MAEGVDHQVLGKRLFRCAVISDTHVNPSDNACNSPFPVNRRANRRFRHVVSDLNQQDLAFVLHLGDLVHPVPGSGTAFMQAAATFHAIASDLRHPMHVIPGNHDIGDKPGAGGPVPATTDKDIATWEETFGAHYGVFEHMGVRFVLMNAQLINSGLAAEAAQKAWVERLLEGPQRTIIALHHPPFICHPDEPDHYDNLQSPGRAWFLELVRSEGVEAIFAGHAHNFWYDRIAQADYYRAPATSFVRQDYAEMQRAVPPSDTEFGRNDVAKLGYFLLDVFEGGHAVQIVRTDGAELDEGDTAPPPTMVAPPPRLAAPGLGIDLRKNWAEVTEIAPSGALDEFDRKIARNDYPLLGLIEMGITRVRVPFADLRDPARRARIKDLATLGINPTVFGLGTPKGRDFDALQELSAILDGVELAFSEEDVGTDLNLDGIALPIFLSPIHTHRIAAPGPHKHVIEHGFLPDSQGAEALLARACSSGASGIVYRILCGNFSPGLLRETAEMANRYKLGVSVHLRTGSDSPAALGEGTQPIIQALNTVVAIMESFPEMRVFLDTLIEQDRGYFPRHGALNELCNPTAISKAIGALAKHKNM